MITTGFKFEFENKKYQTRTINAKRFAEILRLIGDGQDHASIIENSPKVIYNLLPIDVQNSLDFTHFEENVEPSLVFEFMNYFASLQTKVRGLDQNFQEAVTPDQPQS